MIKRTFTVISLIMLWNASVLAQSRDLTHIPAGIHFDRVLQPWDGFGFNYVEASQSRNYELYPQDYGGFSLLSERQRDSIAHLVFGPEGLDVDLVKMFLDPWHQPSPSGTYDHRYTTSNMLDFVLRGVHIRNQNNDHLEVLTTLYGPPPWANTLDSIGGRDLDHDMMPQLAEYIVDWAIFLRVQGIPLTYLSIHNEGEDFYRWHFDTGTQRFERFDYNAYWRPQEVNKFLVILDRAVEQAGLEQLGVTNGEPSNWTRFYQWGYATALAGNSEAMNALDLITTHGFINGDFSKLSYSTSNPRTNDLLRSVKPELHSWVTSMSWGNMDTKFVTMIYENIYNARINGLIPWAGIQDPEEWIGGDPNPGTAIVVRKDSTFEVLPGYYFYKQLTQAGKRGMGIADTYLANPNAQLFAFSGQGTTHPDAFVVNSYTYIWKLPLKIKIQGSDYHSFRAYRTSEDGTEQYTYIGDFDVEDGYLIYDPPYGSTTTFIGVE